MTPEQAATAAIELNKTGKYRADWYYYPGYYEPENDWFVLRRRKIAEIHVAVFKNGKTSGFEML